MPPIDMQRMEMFEGEPVHLYVQRALSRYPAISQNAEFRHVLTQSVDELILTLTTWCASGRIPSRKETETVRWPDGPWEAFKQKYMPRWFVTRCPVRMTEKIIETAVHHYFVCPHINVPAYGRGSQLHIQFMASGSPLAERMSHYADQP
jgi:hypothetical protein